MNKSDSPTEVDGIRAFSQMHQESQIELVLVHVTPDSKASTPWRTLEFWTANSMYGLDAQLRCIEVDTRKPYAKAPTHLLGAVLVGSQARDGDAFSAAFPYPVPGMDAVFRLKNSEKYLNTSPVERVLLRMRITNLDLARDQAPDWKKITSEWNQE